MNNAEAQAHSIAEVCRDVRADIVACEQPESMGIEGRSTNSLGKLLYHVGLIRGFTIKMLKNEPGWFWYPTNKWKGSLAQSVVTKRVNKVCNLNLREDSDGSQDVDIAHAVGVGLYHLSATIGYWEHDPYFGTRGGTRRR